MFSSVRWENLIRTHLRAIAAIAWFDGILPIKRSPFDLVNFVLSPLTILFFIYIFAPSEAAFAVGGALIAVIVGSCIILETEAAFIRLVVRLQDMFVASSLSSVTYVIGLSVAQLFHGLGGIILFSVLISLSGKITFIGGMEIAVASILTWASISALGFMISTFARDIRDLWVYSPLLNVLLSFLPPVFYQMTLIPANLRFLAYLSPTTYTAQIIQQANGLIPSSTTLSDIIPQAGGSAISLLLFDFAGAIIYTVILAFLAARLARWRQK